MKPSQKQIDKLINVAVDYAKEWNDRKCGPAGINVVDAAQPFMAICADNVIWETSTTDNTTFIGYLILGGDGYEWTTIKEIAIEAIKEQPFFC